MSRRPAPVTQADIARAIRAAKAEGWQAVRIVVPGGGVIEVSAATDQAPQPPKRRPVL